MGRAIGRVIGFGKTARRKIHNYASVADAAERMRARNARLTPEQAMHLATHALKQDADGGYSWKFDPYLRAPAPYRLSLQDHIALWSGIACPTLLVAGSESFLPDPEKAGVLGHFSEIFLSSTIGLRKPDAAAYDHVVKAIGVPAHRIVFFDDLAENIEGARMRGLTAVHVTSSDDVANALTALGI